MNTTTETKSNGRYRTSALAALAGLVIVAALALAGCAATGVVGPQTAQTTSPGAAGSVAATVDGNTQRVSVDASQGYFNPGQITVKAGIPTVISFSQSPGGCLSSVVFPQLGIGQDLTAGPADVTIPALQPGTYTFSCQMNMVSGTLVVQ